MKKFISKSFTILLKLLIILVKIFICAIATVVVGYFTLLFGIVAIISEKALDWQLLLYTIISILVLLGTWLIAFIKISKKVKIIYALVFFIWLFSPKIFPSVMKQLDFDSCIDTGICPEGLNMKDKNGETVLINKENCLDANYIWVEKSKSCDFNKNKY